jgi:hypothetical protein
MDTDPGSPVTPGSPTLEISCLILGFAAGDQEKSDLQQTLVNIQQFKQEHGQYKLHISVSFGRKI